MTLIAVRRFGPALALALFAAPVERASAFSSEAQLKCSGDAFRLCSSEIPDVEKITACMKQQRELLSAGCRDVMERGEEASALQSNGSHAQKLSPRRSERR